VRSALSQLEKKTIFVFLFFSRHCMANTRKRAEIYGLLGIVITFLTFIIVYYWLIETLILSPSVLTSTLLLIIKLYRLAGSAEDWTFRKSFLTLVIMELTYFFGTTLLFSIFIK